MSRHFYPDEPDHLIPIREVEEIEDIPIKSGEAINRHDKEVRDRLQTALADGKLVAVAWSDNGECYNVVSEYWRFSPISPLTNDGAHTVETGYLRQLRDIPIPLWGKPCFVEREAFTAWLENKRERRPPAERMDNDTIPKSKGYYADDQPLWQEMDVLLQQSKARSVRDAAVKVANKAKGNSRDSAIERLRHGYARWTGRTWRVGELEK